ncbi:MAG: YbaK/EbsC family protein, partial [Parahaliea sp.]
MAEGRKVQRITGYVLGGVSPLGQKKALPTFLDISAEALDSMHVSAGRRGLEIELAPADLLTLTQGEMVDLCNLPESACLL